MERTELRKRIIMCHSGNLSEFLFRAIRQGNLGTVPIVKVPWEHTFKQCHL